MESSPRCCLIMSGFLAFVLFVLPGCDGSTANNSPTVKADSKQAVKYPLHATIDLGVLIQGESGEARRWLRNDSGQPIKISRIDKSCECVDLQLPKTEIASGERVLGKLTYDGAKEPEFVGELRVELTLFDKEGKQVGLVQIPVEVVKDESNSK